MRAEKLEILGKNYRERLFHDPDLGRLQRWLDAGKATRSACIRIKQTCEHLARTKFAESYIAAGKGEEFDEYFTEGFFFEKLQARLNIAIAEAKSEEISWVFRPEKSILLWIFTGSNELVKPFENAWRNREGSDARMVEEYRFLSRVAVGEKVVGGGDFEKAVMGDAEELASLLAHRGDKEFDELDPNIVRAPFHTAPLEVWAVNKVRQTLGLEQVSVDCELSRHWWRTPEILGEVQTVGVDQNALVEMVAAYEKSVRDGEEVIDKESGMRDLMEGFAELGM